MQVAARGLSELLPSPPIELALVEAAVRVFRSCWQAEPCASEAAPASLVPAAVLAFMTRRVRFFTPAFPLLSALHQWRRMLSPDCGKLHAC